MTVVYSEPTTITPSATEDVFVPSYARGSRKRKPVKTWMILAPIGALALLGGGAALMMSGDKPTAPLIEEPSTMSAPLSAPVSAPLESSTLESLTLPPNAVIENPVVTRSAPAPVVRETAPPPPPAVRARRAQPTASTPAPAVREQAPAVSAGPTTYTPAPSSGSTTPPAPSIPVAPLN